METQSTSGACKYQGMSCVDIRCKSESTIHFGTLSTMAAEAVRALT